MRRSHYFIPLLKETPAEAQVVSHQLCLRAGLIRQVAAGNYDWLPLGLKVLRKVENIVREEMDKAGALEILMPGVLPADLWKETGRYEKYGPELLRFKDRNDRECVLGPTHEEAVTQIFRDNVKSYREVPLNLYQMQWKFRDEMRPRFGLMRGREFLMKDAYSFDTDREKSLEAYQRMYDAYTRIFDRLGLQWRAVVADTGAIGGNYSHEFQVLADTGEDTLLFDPDSDYAVNIEKYDAATAPKPREQLVEKKGIEVGHCFHLGDLYSEKMSALVTLEDGKSIPVVMGCYGIGVSRLVAAAIEQSHDDKGVIWPEPMAPFKVGVANIRHSDATCTDMATKLYLHLQAQGVETLYDDRDVSAGQKFAEMDLIGLPWQAIIGPKNAAEGKIEWKNRKTGETQLLSANQLPW
ncbi:MAG: proline--tRNA ligase [Blastochloris viridis]|uniref:Proline--tRNA ligase n=1 Tax=Blastochloris viridis TaxID=1079 RepID=A0A6N4RCG3_BLAVI|nr:MAG: proline--tRNA ligase [Blastochloris viridis]